MGALSLLTPCVFPMVPITVSYFTNHAAPTRARAIGSARSTALGIVLTFTVLGQRAGGGGGRRRPQSVRREPVGQPRHHRAVRAVRAEPVRRVRDLAAQFRLLTRIDGLSRRRGTSVAGTLLMAGHLHRHLADLHRRVSRHAARRRGAGRVAAAGRRACSRIRRRSRCRSSRLPRPRRSSSASCRARARGSRASRS